MRGWQSWVGRSMAKHDASPSPLLRGEPPHSLLDSALLYISNRAFSEAMNWTGGSLQRTKKANSGVLRQQKAYFAKARTNPPSAPRTPAAPFRPSYLRDDDKPGPVGLSPFSSSLVRRSERPVTGQVEASQRGYVPMLDKTWSATGGYGASPHELSSRHAAHHSVQPETPLQAQQGKLQRMDPSSPL